MRARVYDTTFYVDALRQGDDGLLDLRWSGANEPVWLSAVVLAELLAGADQRARRGVETLERHFTQSRRLLIPTAADWSSAGRVLAHVGRNHGHERIGRARLANDALLAVSVRRLGAVLFTRNVRDFTLIAEACPLQWRVEPGVFCERPRQTPR